jgi:hypothetical protein
MKLLIFTDSRGEHQISFKDKLIFTKKIKQEIEKKNGNVDLMLCKYKWTTTMDFINEVINNKININKYDYIILYTGIVEFSPRPIDNAISDIYFGKYQIIGNKIKNEKKVIMDYLFSEEKNNKNFKNPYPETYLNNKTVSLITTEMLKKYMIPWLNKNIGNKLIYINSNNIVQGWEGNYLKINPNGRPKNIKIIEKYADICKKNFKNIIDLSLWNNDEIKKYTIDNMHLTYEGSEYIYNKLKNLIRW